MIFTDFSIFPRLSLIFAPSTSQVTLTNSFACSFTYLSTSRMLSPPINNATANIATIRVVKNRKSIERFFLRFRSVFFIKLFFSHRVVLLWLMHLVYHNYDGVSRENEIARGAMKSSRCSDEIFSLRLQMKLNPSSYPDEVGFHHEVISSHDSGIYPVRKDGFS